MCAIALFLIAIFSEKMLNGLVGLGIKIIDKVYKRRVKRINNSHILSDNIKESRLKRIEQSNANIKNKIEESANKYKANAKEIKNNKKVIIKTLFVYFVQYFLYFSISYWAYRAVGLNSYNMLKITSLQSVVWGTTSGIPSPGAVGASEAAYMGLFKNVISTGLINSVMLLTRVMNFYMFVLLSGIIALFVLNHRKNKSI